MDIPKWYIIQVEGRLDDPWSGLFENMQLSAAVAESGITVTTLSGSLVDETQLHSLLARIRDLGLHLLLVRRVETQIKIENKGEDRDVYDKG